MHVYDGRGSGQELASLDKIHSTKITFMKVHIYIYIPYINWLSLFIIADENLWVDTSQTYLIYHISRIECVCQKNANCEF